jgi:hypothetical protein
MDRGFYKSYFLFSCQEEKPAVVGQNDLGKSNLIPFIFPGLKNFMTLFLWLLKSFLSDVSCLFGKVNIWDPPKPHTLPLFFG